MRSSTLVIALAACASAPPSTPPPAPWQMTGAIEHRMLNCPSSVEFATTRIVRRSDGVNVIITSPDPLARTQILELAAFHAQLAAPTGRSEHSGDHGGPGTIGHCPIIHDGTTVTFTPRPDGVTMHVVTPFPEHVISVQHQTEQRLARMPTLLLR